MRLPPQGGVILLKPSPQDMRFHQSGMGLSRSLNSDCCQPELSASFYTLSTLRRPKLLHQQCQGYIQLESVAGGAGEEESTLSNKASSLDSIAASRLFSCFSRSISFSISFVRRSLSRSLICASIVGCQFNFANKRRHGGKEERNSDLLIDLKVEESEEIDMAI